MVFLVGKFFKVQIKTSKIQFSAFTCESWSNLKTTENNERNCILA